MNKQDRFFKFSSSQSVFLENIRKEPNKSDSVQSLFPSLCLRKFIFTKSKIASTNNSSSNFNAPHLTFSPLQKRNYSTFFDKSPRIPFKNSKNDFNSKILTNQEEQIIQLSGVENDFYTHMVDSVSKKHIAFGLFKHLVLFNTETGLFCKPTINTPRSDPEYGNLCSLSVNTPKPEQFALGDTNGFISLLDINKTIISKIILTHQDRIGSIKFHPTKPYLLASGSKDYSVVLQDLRVKFHKSKIFEFSHDGEICGLSWQQRGYCIASGGNDNLVKIWDLRKTSSCILKITEHKAAIRALEFCPLNQDLLASGGGTGDTCLRISSLKNKGKDSMVIKTHSQICSLLWDTNCNRLLTSHGFSKYQMCLWDLEKEKLVAEYYGHQNRILDIIRLKGSPHILSFSSDDTAKTWDPFKAPIKSRRNLFTPAKLR